MKRLLCLSVATICCTPGFSQISFNAIVETGIMLPLDGKSANSTHNDNGVHIGNHLDLGVGSGCFTWGIGAYLGHGGSLGINNKYKEEGIAIARKYQMSPSQLSFNASSFQSTQFLLGPVIGLGKGNFNMRLWAKGGFGLNEAGKYAVTYREGNIEQRIYVTNGGENKNGLAYDLGAGFFCLLSRQLGVQLSASYNSAKTDMVNYSYDREKGMSPSYQTAKNAFIKASVGLVFHLHDNSSSVTGRAINTSRSNIKSPTRYSNERGTANGTVSPRDGSSGLATGRRMHKPMVVRMGSVTDSAEYATREAGSGMATGRRDSRSGLPTGRRMHKPIVITVEMAGEAEIVSPRDAASGMPTGKRMHKPFVITIDNAEEAEIVSPRDAASGMPTGKRMHKPFVITIDNAEEAEIVSPRDAASGMPTGKRMHKPIVITKEIGRIVIIDNDPYDVTDDEEGIASNPLYEGSGGNGQNPLYEAKDVQADNPMYQGKSINEKGIKRSEGKGITQSGKGISEKGIKRMDDKGINEAGKGIQEPGIPKTVNTSRANIKRINSVVVNGDNADIDCVIEENGKEYQVTIKGKVERRVEVLKSN